MPPRTDVILWIDLETTGNEPNYDSIIEIGALLTDSSPALKELSYISIPVRPTNNVDPEHWDPIVREMHTANGLIDSLPYASPLGEAEEILYSWLLVNAGHSKDHIPLAGSGVGHFDRPFIKHELPKINRRLTYWVYDVGVMRRMLRLAGIEIAAGDQSTKSHRALDDIRQHAQEARDYNSLLQHLQAGIAFTHVDPFIPSMRIAA